MRSQNRGGPPALPPDEAAVTYSRLEDAEELPQFGADRPDSPDGEGRVEPHFTAVRVDTPPPRRRAARVAEPLDDFADAPLALDPEELGALGAVSSRRARPPRRRRSAALRVVMLLGALAIIGGVGVLAATAVKVIYGGPAVATAPTAPLNSEAPATAATADPTAVPLTTPDALLPDSGSAGPGVLAIPASQGGPIDMTPGTSAQPAPQAEATPAAPEAQPLAAAPASSAALTAPPLPKEKPAPIAAPVASAAPAPLAPVASAPQATAPATDADIDRALNDVDRLLAEKKAAAALAAANTPPPADQAAALTLAPAPAMEPPPLPAPTTVTDPSIPVPPADIPNASN